MGKNIWLLMYPRNFGSHVTVRPPARPSTPQAYQCKVTKNCQSVVAISKLGLSLVFAFRIDFATYQPRFPANTMKTNRHFYRLNCCT